MRRRNGQQCKPGGENPGGGQSAAAEATTLKFNLVKSNTDPQYEWYGRFFDDLEAASNGEIVGEIYTTESLGPTADVIEQAALGERVVADCDLAWLANYVPDMAAIMSPYLIQKPEEIMAIWNSEVFQDMCTELEAQGLHLIALNYEGTRNLLTKKDITSRADVNGLKMRFHDDVECCGRNAGRQSDKYRHERNLPGAQPGRGGCG